MGWVGVGLVALIMLTVAIWAFRVPSDGPDWHDGKAPDGKEPSERYED